MHDHRLNDCTMQIYFMLPVRAKVQWGCFGYPPPPKFLSHALTHHEVRWVRRGAVD